MTETITGEVIHVVEPDELDDYDLDATVKSLAESRYILVCRKGGVPSLFEKVVAFFRRDPIEPVTLIADRGPAEGAEITATVTRTDVSGVYDVVEIA